MRTVRLFGAYLTLSSATGKSTMGTFTAYSEIDLADEADTAGLYFVEKEKSTKRNNPGMAKLPEQQGGSAANTSNEVSLGSGIQ